MLYRGGTLLAVKGLYVSFRPIQLQMIEIELRRGLLGSIRLRTLIEFIKVNDFRILLYDSQGNEFTIERGCKLRIRSPMILYRVCGGDAHAVVVRKGDYMDIRLDRLHCLRKAVNGLFCNQHRYSEYAKYLHTVFQEPRSEPAISLAKLPHMIYLLHFGGNLVKVGITNIVKNIRRLAEQPFINAVILAIVPSLLEARRIEIALSRLSPVTDRLRIDERLRRLRDHASSLNAEIQELAQVLISVVQPKLRSLGIDVDLRKPIPVLSLDEDTRRVYSAFPAVTKASLSSIEGVGEVLDFVPGALLLSIDGKSLLVPYQYLRDHALNIEILT